MLTQHTHDDLLSFSINEIFHRQHIPYLHMNVCSCSSVSTRYDTTEFFFFCLPRVCSLRMRRKSERGNSVLSITFHTIYTFYNVCSLPSTESTHRPHSELHHFFCSVDENNVNIEVSMAHIVVIIIIIAMHMIMFAKHEMVIKRETAEPWRVKSSTAKCAQHTYQPDTVSFVLHFRSHCRRRRRRFAYKRGWACFVWNVFRFTKHFSQFSWWQFRRWITIFRSFFFAAQRCKVSAWRLPHTRGPMDEQRNEQMRTK